MSEKRRAHSPLSVLFVGAVLVLLVARACQPEASAPVSEEEAQPVSEVLEDAVEEEPAKASGPAWESLGEGLEVGVWSPTPGVQAHALRLDPRRWSLRSLLAGELVEAVEGEGAPLMSVGDFAERVEAAAVINGGFFDPANKPMGLRISEGKRLVPHRKVDWGVFTVSKGAPGLIHARDWKPRAGVDFAIECGPRLVHRGKPFKLKPNLHRRTVIGHTPTGQVALIVTLDPIDLNSLAEALAKPTDKGGLGLEAALNLDGGPSSQLQIKGQRGWSISGLTGVADAVAVFPRD